MSWETVVRGWVTRDYCRCGKVIFDDAAQAWRAARVMNGRAHPGPMVITAYVCRRPDSSAWHVGHEPRTAKR